MIPVRLSISWRRTVLAACLVVSGCAGPEQPSYPGPALTCPATVTVPSPTGGPATVNYPSPLGSGGAPPVSAPSCSPATGSQFPVGSTTVTCNAQDAEGRRASCTFTVHVTAPPQLSVDRFVAFGDSITEGKTGDCIRPPFRGYSAASLAMLLDELRMLPSVPAGTDYPGALQAMLVNRYTAQTPSVANKGVGGEYASDSDTRDRLQRALSEHAAQALLLQQGINDLHENSSPAGIADIADALRLMVRQTQVRGIGVFVGTLLPQRPGGCRAFAPAGSIQAANNVIRAMAMSEGAVLVDLYPVVASDLQTLLGEDGLHPTIAGYAKIAETFFEAIRNQLETPVPSGR